MSVKKKVEDFNRSLFLKYSDSDYKGCGYPVKIECKDVCIKCCRELKVQNNNNEKSNYEVLNSYLDRGWEVVMVTPKPGYNEYIIEREINIT